MGLKGLDEGGISRPGGRDRPRRRAAVGPRRAPASPCSTSTAKPRARPRRSDERGDRPARRRLLGGRGYRRLRRVARPLRVDRRPPQQRRIEGDSAPLLRAASTSSTSCSRSTCRRLTCAARRASRRDRPRHRGTISIPRPAPPARGSRDGPVRRDQAAVLALTRNAAVETTARSASASTRSCPDRRRTPLSTASRGGPVGGLRRRCRLPVGRPEEVAALVAGCSDEAPYRCGGVYTVDGAETAA